ncbi:MAG TPA: ABC transporter permease [Xanthobacteraceae bacterium]|nr:ABC transporter permease [Xanthobacteraceae bacterium]
MSTQATNLTAPLLSRVPGVAIVLILLSAIFGVLSPGFTTPANVANILTQSTILLLLALPMTVIIMTEGLDLSIGAVLTFSSIVLAVTVIATGSPTLAFLAALAVGLGFGLGNGVLVAVFDIPPFITTLGTLGIAQGLSLLVTDGQSVVGIPSSIEHIYSGTVAGIPLPVGIAALAYLATHGLLYHTRFGTYVFALGGNREALRVAGISVRGMLIRVYAFGGLMAGFAALLMTARLNSAHPTAGIGMEFDAIAAAAVGGTSFERGNGWLFGTLLGVIAVGVLRNGLNLLAVPSSTQVACIGAMVIVALFIDGLRSER